MSQVERRDEAEKHKFDAEWNNVDGWHFSYKTKRLWEIKTGYVVADLIEKEGGNKRFESHERFTDLADALDYMRTGKR